MLEAPDYQVSGLRDKDGSSAEGPHAGLSLPGCEINVQLINVLSEQRMLEPRDDGCRRPVAVELSKPWIS